MDNKNVQLQTTTNDVNAWINNKNKANSNKAKKLKQSKVEIINYQNWSNNNKNQLIHKIKEEINKKFENQTSFWLTSSSIMANDASF